MNPRQLGPYRLIRRLGRGGMGTVYEGVNVDTGESAAVKVLSGELGHEPDFRNRFASEIETLRRLDHPNIVRLFGFGEHDEQLFYAMELVAGISLEEEMHRGRRFSWQEVIRIGSQTCLALRHAHDRGIIHRDIKPANLLWTADGVLKLSDFGIARLFGNARMTMVGSVIGTVEYMAPEQANAKGVDARTDLYCLGGVLYALLAGHPPFVAKTIHEMLHKQRFEQPRPLGEFVPDVPEDLTLLIAQLLEKDPARRVPNATLLGRRLDVIEIGVARQAAQKPEPIVPTPQEADKTPPSDAVHAHLAGARPDVTGMAPTRAMDDEDPPREAERINPTPTREMPPSDDLQETRSTDAFFVGPPADAPAHNAGAEPEAALRVPLGITAAIPPSATVASKPTVRFTTVGEDELGHIPTPEEPRPPIFSAQTAVLVAALVMIALTTWYFLQPPEADDLYERIIERTRDGSIDSIRGEQKDIEDFLTLYSDDPRARNLQKFERDMELDRLKRKFAQRARGLSRKEDLLPVAQAYDEAEKYSAIDPALGATKLRALLALYGNQADDSGPTGLCLELARRRLVELEEEIHRTAADRLAVIHGQLDAADRLRATDPEKARQMAEAVVELYADKPWAAEAVARARESLAPPRPKDNASGEKK